MNWKTLIILASLTLGFYACGGNEHSHSEGQKTEQHEGHNEAAEHMENMHKEEAAQTQDSTQSENSSESTEAVTEAKYQCPMKCEGEKVYDKPGKCPKCGMDLEPVK